jgi:hypothetical protein
MLIVLAALPGSLALRAVPSPRLRALVPRPRAFARPGAAPWCRAGVPRPRAPVRPDHPVGIAGRPARRPGFAVGSLPSDRHRGLFRGRVRDPFVTGPVVGSIARRAVPPPARRSQELRGCEFGAPTGAPNSHPQARGTRHEGAASPGSSRPNCRPARPRALASQSGPCLRWTYTGFWWDE